MLENLCQAKSRRKGNKGLSWSDVKTQLAVKYNVYTNVKIRIIVIVYEILNFIFS